MGVKETDSRILTLNRLEVDLRQKKYRLQIELGYSLRKSIGEDNMTEFNLIAARIHGIDDAIESIIEARMNIIAEK